MANAPIAAPLISARTWCEGRRRQTSPRALFSDALLPRRRQMSCAKPLAAAGCGRAVSVTLNSRSLVRSLLAPGKTEPMALRQVPFGRASCSSSSSSSSASAHKRAPLALGRHQAELPRARPLGRSRVKSPSIGARFIGNRGRRSNERANTMD